MSALVRAEIRKLFTTRLVWGMPLAQLLLGALFSGITGAFMLWGSLPGPGGSTVSPSETLDHLTLARMVYTGGVQLGYLLALVLGILAIGAEFRHRTLTSTFLAAPRRGRVLGAKALALVWVGLINAIAHIVGCLAAGAPLLAAKGLPVFPEPVDLLGTLARVVMVLVLWTLMGLGLGLIIKNQVLALFVGVAVAWIVEPLLGFGLGFVDGGSSVARFFPSQATSSALSVFAGVDPQTTQTMGGAADQLDWWVAALVLLGYAALLTVIGWLLTERRDVD